MNHNNKMDTISQTSNINNVHKIINIHNINTINKGTNHINLSGIEKIPMLQGKHEIQFYGAARRWLSYTIETAEA